MTSIGQNYQSLKVRLIICVHPTAPEAGNAVSPNLLYCQASKCSSKFGEGNKSHRLFVYKNRQSPISIELHDSGISRKVSRWRTSQLFCCWSSQPLRLHPQSSPRDKMQGVVFHQDLHSKAARSYQIHLPLPTAPRSPQRRNGHAEHKKSASCSKSTS